MHGTPHFRARIVAKLLPVALLLAAAAGAAPRVRQVDLVGTVNPASAYHVISALKLAQEEHCDALLLTLDTPGGLESSMRDIVKAILASNIPVVTYVSPAGARSASAGVFLMAASHVAAMAPGTNLGAAHPVNLGGAIADSILGAKATNDASAYIRTLAAQRGRNVNWYERAVRRSISATEQEALSLHLVEILCRSPEALMGALEGRRVTLSSGREVVLHTRGALIVPTPPSLRTRILDGLSDPNLAYLLITLGFYGILFELMHPGGVLPGVLGGIALLLAFFSMQTLPVSYVGVLFLIFALILFIADLKVPSHGILTLGGIVSFVLGSLLLIRGGSEGSGLQVAGWLVAAVTVSTTLFFGLILRAALKARKRPVVTGREALVGQSGKVMEACSPLGTVYASDAYWTATSEEPLPAGTPVRIVAVEGLTLRVRRA